MQASPDTAQMIVAGPRPVLEDDDRSGLRRGAVGSLLLHVLAAITAILLMPRMIHPLPEEIAVPVDIVRLGDRAGTGGGKEAPALPGPSDSPAPLAPTPSAAEPAPASTEAAKTASSPPPPAPKAAPTKLAQHAKPDALTPLAHEPTPTELLQAKLKELSKLRQPDNPAAGKSSQDRGTPGGVAGGGTDASGGHAAYDVRDFVRAQIERRWYLDAAMAAAGDVTVTLHVAITRNGEVTVAEIVGTRPDPGDAVHRAIARSARNAALLSSPILLPDGRHDALDLTLDLDAKDSVR